MRRTSLPVETLTIESIARQEKTESCWLDVRLPKAEIEKAHAQVQELVGILSALSNRKWMLNLILGTELESKYAKLPETMNELFSLIEEFRNIKMDDFLVLDAEGNIQRDPFTNAIIIHKKIDSQMIAQLATCLKSLSYSCSHSEKAKREMPTIIRLIADIMDFANKLARSIDDATTIAVQRHHKNLQQKLQEQLKAKEQNYQDLFQRHSAYIAENQGSPNEKTRTLADKTKQNEDLIAELTALKLECATLQKKNEILQNKVVIQQAELNVAQLDNKILKNALSKPTPKLKRFSAWRQIAVGGLAVLGAVLLAAGVTLSLTGIGAVIGIPTIALSIGIGVGAAALAGSAGLGLFNLISASREDKRYKIAVQQYQDKHNALKEDDSSVKIQKQFEANLDQPRKNSAAPEVILRKNSAVIRVPRKLSFMSSL